ncbi:auxin efflux carrier [Peniophora sp. CONT]|nr:auxin efflux carrier [Peniophora sp. CONT]
MLSAGALIWISIRPLIRTFGIIGAGFALTKADLFPVEAARGVGQMILNIVMPCLLFSRIVPAFDSQNVKNIGPLVVVSLVLGILGFFIAWLVKKWFWVPHRFRNGILAAGAWGNIGDIPTAIALGITANAPFNGTADENLAVAYIAVFILVFFVTLFPLGGLNLIASDFKGPDREVEDLIEETRARRKRILKAPALLAQRLFHRPAAQPTEKESDAEAGPKLDEKHPATPSGTNDSPQLATGYRTPSTYFDDHSTPYGASTPGAMSACSERNLASAVTSPTPTVHDDDGHRSYHPRSHGVRFKEDVPSIQKPILTRRQRIRKIFSKFLSDMLKPAPVSVLVSLPIALINPLKALFVAPTSDFRPSFHPTAPDGMPPLNFILDIATFAGNASVPLGLICLGAALARLDIGGRENWARMPRGAIAALAVGKMLIAPVICIAMITGMVHRGFIDPSDKVLQFVCLICSGLPTATTQVYITQVHNPTGSAEHLAAFLIPQYIIMVFSMTGISVYSINYIS